MTRIVCTFGYHFHKHILEKIQPFLTGPFRVLKFLLDLYSFIICCCSIFEDLVIAISGITNGDYKYLYQLT